MHGAEECMEEQNWLIHVSVIDAVQRPADGWVLVANTVQALIPARPGVKGR